MNQRETYARSPDFYDFLFNLAVLIAFIAYLYVRLFIACSDRPILTLPITGLAVLPWVLAYRFLAGLFS